jgi:hypothetical protein
MRPKNPHNYLRLVGSGHAKQPTPWKLPLQPVCQRHNVQGIPLGLAQKNTWKALQKAGDISKSPTQLQGVENDHSMKYFK